MNVEPLPFWSWLRSQKEKVKAYLENLEICTKIMYQNIVWQLTSSDIWNELKVPMLLNRKKKHYYMLRHTTLL